MVGDAMSKGACMFIIVDNIQQANIIKDKISYTN